MSRKGNTKAEKNKNISGEKIRAVNGFTGCLALLPGLFMCAMLFIMLVLDVAMPGMADGQYEVFPGVFTALDYMSVACGLFYIALSAKKRELRLERSDALFAAFAILIIISTCVNGLNFMTIDGVPYRYIGIFNTIAFMFVYMGVTRCIGSELQGHLILMGYLACADLIGIAALYDRVSGGIAAFQGKKELSAIFFNGNHYGYFLMMASLIGIAYYLFDSRGKAAFGAASAGLNLLLLAINHSLGSILATAIVLMATAALIAKNRQKPKGESGAKNSHKTEGGLTAKNSQKSKGGLTAKNRQKAEGESGAKNRQKTKGGSTAELNRERVRGSIEESGRGVGTPKKMLHLACVLVAAFAAAMLISPALRKEFITLASDLAAIAGKTADGSAGHRRLQMWTLTTGYISERPLIGYGCEGIAFMLYEAMKVSDPHCEVLAYAAYYGIPAALLYAAGVMSVIITSLRRMNDNGVQQKAACMAASAYFISSFVGVGMFYTLPFFFVFLGLSLKR